MRRVISSSSSFLFFPQYAFPRPRRDTRTAFPCSSTSSSRFALSFFSPVTVKHEGVLVLRGRATRSADGLSTFAATSPLCILRLGCSLLDAPACERGRGWGEYNLRLLLRSKKAAATVQGKTKKRFTTEILQKELSAGENAGPRGGRGARVGLEVDLFPAVWELSRGSLPSARGPQPLYPMRRPTARIAWTVQPMRPQQRDRAAESRAFPLGMDGVGSRSFCSRGPSLPQAVSYSRPVSLFIYLPVASRTTHKQCLRGLPQCAW